MNNILERIQKIDRVSNLLTTEDNFKFCTNNSERFDRLSSIIDEIESDVESYQISVTKVSQFNSEEEKSSTITKFLFPIYWGLWFQLFGENNEVTY